MTRPLSLAAVWLLTLAAGCATAPARPAPAPAPAAEAKAPHLLDGCVVMEETPAAQGYVLKCRTLLATVKRTPADVPPEALVAAHIAGFRQAVHADVRSEAMKKPLTIAGHPRQATMLGIYADTKASAPKWLGIVSAWQDPDGKVTLVSCGAALAADGQVCGKVLAFMITHPTAPPDLARDHAAPAAALAVWIPAGALGAPAGCQRVKATAKELHLRCADGEVVLTRMGPLDGPPKAGVETAILDAIGRALVENLQKKNQAAIEMPLERRACQVGADPGKCAHVRLRVKGESVDVDLAVGRLFGALATVQCFRDAGAGHLPEVCGRVMRLSPAP